MKQVNDFLINFSTPIKKLIEIKKENVVLGGSLALELHGLKLGWIPEDIDIIIFDPTAGQIAYVCDSQFFEKSADYKTEELLGQMDIPLRSWQKEYNKKKMNVILAFKERTPEDLMTYNETGLTDISILVNSIDNILNAKLSYSVGQDKTFLRKKDVEHFTKLKNNNFNI